MPPRTIKQITALKGLGIFDNFEASADVPDLQKYNLIYGFNRSGKTTLSRVFASLGTGAFNPDLPAEGRFEISLTDGTSIKSAEALDALKGRVFVFNVDFIKENLRWNEGTANPVYYLGKEQAELAKKLEGMESDRITLEQKYAESVRDHGSKEKAFADHKRDAARLIGEQISQARKYDATNLATDYSQRSYPKTLTVADEERQQLRAVLAQDAPLPKRNILDTAPFRLGALVHEARSVLTATIGALALHDLRQHESMLRWVKEGVDYHEAHDLTSCLLCGNELTSERVTALRQAIDGKFEKLVRDITDTKEKLARLQDRLAAIKNAVPSINDISSDLRSKFSAAVDDLQTVLARVSEVVSSALALFEMKASAPNIRVDVVTLPSETEATQWDTIAFQKVSALNELIEAHNTSHDDFTNTQDVARQRLKEHFLAEGEAVYRELAAEVAEAKSLNDKLQQERLKLANEIENTKLQARRHGPAAAMINNMVRGYLGHTELEISTSEEGYEIRRDGKAVAASLSEGEKTAIALCYFLCTLEAEGRQTKNLIVVVDDPISSLDTRALHYAFSLIKGELGSAGQLMVMTHNLQFMNEVKKWLKPKANKEDKVTAALLFLDVVQPVGGGRRSSSIKRMPPLIRDYDSEYQYLFSLVLAFARSSSGQTEYFYMMPNALRKVLEIFLAFILPGADGLSSKVDAIARGEYGIDAARIRALDRLVQLESHADNLDDLVMLSPLAIEETKDAADALILLMETVDKKHFDRMCKLCG